MSAGLTTGTDGNPTTYCPGKPWQQVDPNGYCARYEVEVQLPECDANNNEVHFIITDQDWQEINSPDKRIFCVQPGDYQAAGTIEITASGDSASPRVLRYFNPNSAAHPAQQTDQAVVMGVRLNDADYWIIHGLTFKGPMDTWATPIRFDASNYNIIDKVLVEGGGGGSGQVNLSNEGNVLQNSVLRKTALLPGTDMHCVTIVGASKDIRIVNNEIYDCGGDGIQTHPGEITGLSVIENNDIYITPGLYTDCNGTQVAGGDCACAENAIDLKSGGIKGGPLLVLNNRGWGFRTTDTACSGSGSLSHAAIIHGADGKYILMQGNVFFDAPGGIHTPNTQPHHVSIIGNVISDLLPNGVGIGQLHKSVEFEIYLNTLIDAGTIEGIQNHHVKCNVVDDSNRNDKLCLWLKRWSIPTSEQYCMDKGRLEDASLPCDCRVGIGEVKGFGIDDYTIWGLEGSAIGYDPISCFH